MIDVSVVAAWLVLCLGLGLAGGIIALGVLPLLGRYAVAFGLPVALFVLGLVGLWFGHLSITAGLWVGIALLLLSSLVVVRCGEWYEQFRRGMPAFGVFGVSFLFLLALRVLDPAVDPASGEKFLNFGLLQAHLRADVLPAEDIWFAGEPFSYYYAGHFVASLLARLTGTAARYAYNLSLATFYATLVTASYGLTGAIGKRWNAGTAAALMGAFFAGFASNLLTVSRLLVWALPDSIASLLGDGTVSEFALSPGSFHYWSASRIVPTLISEFPLFAYLNGDLHAHMLAMPFELLAVACLYAYFCTDSSQRRYRQVLLFGVIPAVSGFVAATNAWSVPVIAGLTWLTVYFRPSSLGTLGPGREWISVPFNDSRFPAVSRTWGRLLGSSLVVGVVLVLAVVWSLPFWHVSETSGMALGVFPARSSLGALLLIHGPFLAVLVPSLLSRLSPGVSTYTTATMIGMVIAAGGVLFPTYAAVVLFGTLAVVVWRGLERTQRGEHTDLGFETLLAFAGFSLIVLVELVYLREPAKPGRFNTFYKTYAQIWVLFSVAAGVVVGRFVTSRRAIDLTPVSNTVVRGLVVAVLLISTGVYGMGAVHQWTTAENDAVRSPDEPTLDALAFAEQRYPDQMAAIEWLDNRSGTPTIISVPGAYIWREYRWVNAPSSLTGVPTVAGWAHESAYRGADTYWNRVDDVGLMFNGSRKTQSRLLAHYEVQYIFYGPLERERYGATLFSNRTAVREVYENDAVTIYRVNQTRLTDRLAADTSATSN
ncbi:DUF2298 domain-containing protein [Halorientalis brevis]|uniref:DUF2298 domain-containing protein n=1 Tax=Halorientalis brevis TaxID=1126241 RepID=A0ABD6CGK3_9EURY